MSEARVLIYDLETAPNLGYTWNKYDTTVIDFKEHWYILCFAYKWLGEKETHVVALPDFDLYKTDPTNDSELVKVLRELFDQADITVTHNGVTFDKPKAQTRMIAHGIEPPSPYKEIDTLRVARRQFAFTSNSLADLCKQLGLPGKLDNGGFQTWLGCLSGNPASWNRMKVYNKRDVTILERLYLRFLPWIPRMPNLAAITDRPNSCPRCGKGPLIARGWHHYSVTKRRQFQCKSCHGYCVGRQVTKTQASFTNL